MLYTLLVGGRLMKVPSCLGPAANRSLMPHARLSTSSGTGQKQFEFSRRASGKHPMSIVYYLASGFTLMLGLGFAAAPLYEKYCNRNSISEQIDGIEKATEKTKNLKRVAERQLTIIFIADHDAMLQWNFRPLQDQIKLVPGETVLAFYTAENPSDKPISGVSTYNVVPYQAAQYLNKIQCFCFDEQRLNPHEQVDMPVFFYIDPDYVKDPELVGADVLTLSYTFFQAREEFRLPFISRYDVDVGHLDKLKLDTS